MRKERCRACQKVCRSARALADHLKDKHGIRPPAPKTPAPRCGECGELANQVGGDVIYPHRSDLHEKPYWLCACGAYCGCHPGTDVPLGTPANTATRAARSAAHAAFDPFWKRKVMTRGHAYTRLADALQIDREECHIGMMNAARARQVVRICAQWKDGAE